MKVFFSSNSLPFCLCRGESMSMASSAMRSNVNPWKANLNAASVITGQPNNALSNTSTPSPSPSSGHQSVASHSHAVEATSSIKSPVVVTHSSDQSQLPVANNSSSSCAVEHSVSNQRNQAIEQSNDAGE